VSRVCITAPPLGTEASFSIVKRLLLASVRGRVELCSKPSQAELHVHVGTPDSFRPELLGPRENKLVFYTVAEATRVPDYWVRSLNQCDEVWAPSRFTIRAMAQSGVSRPMRLIPHGVDCRVPTIARPSCPDDEPFTVLWQGSRLKAYRAGQPSDGDRKGGLLLERAFRRANLPRSRLILKYLPIEGSSYDFRVGPVWYICKSMSAGEIHELDEAADVFVWPTRGEGFGMTPLEKLAKGIPAFATYWSGPREYLRDFPLPRLMPAGLEHVRFNGAPARMARIAETALIELLNCCYRNRRELNAQRPLLAGIAREKWDYRHVLRPRLLAAIRRICG
jgi:glycosyltransferase involved in cell wall biosynthesis